MAAGQRAVLERPLLSGRRQRSYRRLFLQYPLGSFGLVTLAILVLMAVFPQLFTPLDTQDIYAQDLFNRLRGPSLEHWFGTDQLGRDLYARIVAGTRTSVLIGLGVVSIGVTLSLVFGTISAYFGGWFDTVFQRLIDIAIAVPGLVFIILMITIVAAITGDIIAIVLSIAFLNSTSSSRTFRSAALSVVAEDYVDGARALGATPTRILIRHVTPNLMHIVIVSASILVGNAVLVESALSFLGYGVQPPTPSWGRMLSEAREYLFNAPHVAVFPGLMIFAIVFASNMLGDALRDILDPRLRGAR